MKDANGAEIHVGDRVKVWEGKFGTVVCDLDSRQESEGFALKNWEQLGRGVLIKFENGGLLHLDEADEDLELAHR
jgi:hypothetical protein